jgi:hypothetical protein
VLFWVVLVGAACFGLFRLWLLLRRRGIVRHAPKIEGPVLWLIIAGVVGMVASAILIIVMVVFLLSRSTVTPAPATQSAVPSPTPTPVAAPSTTQAATTSAALGKVYIDVSKNGYVNVRTDAAATAKLIRKLTASTTVSYTAQKSGWYEIELDDGVVGWVIGTYATKR